MSYHPLFIGALQLNHSLIQGPLAGYSCAPFRELFTQFTPPAYCVSEMLSAYDVLHKHKADGRYLYRSKNETLLCYQISGTDPFVMADAASRLEDLKADLIDINCGCPKAKIRKKGAGSALLENLSILISIIQSVRQAIRCPLTVKIRLQGSHQDLFLAQAIADAGADALIVHGRRWTDDYNIPCDLKQIAQIKQVIDIPVIMNGDIEHIESLSHAKAETGCDGFMISRASTGKPWLFESLLTNKMIQVDYAQQVHLFMTHLQGLAALENEHQAVLQSKSLVRYYFKDQWSQHAFQSFYALTTLKEIAEYLVLQQGNRILI